MRLSKLSEGTLGTVLVVLLLAGSSSAGGPLVVGGPTLGTPGEPIVWDNSKSIQYRTDGGPLGSLSNAVAVNDVAAMLQTWAGVPTASISFKNAGPIMGVADGDVSTVTEFDAVYANCAAGTQTPSFSTTMAACYSLLPATAACSA